MFYENLKRICDEKGTTVTAVLKALNLSTGSKIGRASCRERV